MPVLPNPRHEAFAQAIVKGLASERPNGKNTAKAAYLAAGYSPSNDRSATVAASRLLTIVDPVVQRIRELQEQALARLDRKLDVSRERIGRRLDLASRMAEQENKPETIVSSELGLAVKPQEVIPGQTESADRRFACEANMRPVPVVAMEPSGQRGISLL